MSHVRIRTARESDAPTLHEIHTISVRELCRKDYSPDIIEGWLKNRSPEGYLRAISAGEMYVAELDGQIVGFGHAVPGEVKAVFVHPKFSNQGIGISLAKHGIKLARSESPDVVRVEATLNARRFYEKLGFSVIRETNAQRNDIHISILEMMLVTEI